MKRMHLATAKLTGYTYKIFVDDLSFDELAKTVTYQDFTEKNINAALVKKGSKYNIYRKRDFPKLTYMGVVR